MGIHIAHRRRPGDSPMGACLCPSARLASELSRRRGRDRTTGGSTVSGGMSSSRTGASRRRTSSWRTDVSLGRARSTGTARA